MQLPTQTPLSSIGTSQHHKSRPSRLPLKDYSQISKQPHQGQKKLTVGLPEQPRLHQFRAAAETPQSMQFSAPQAHHERSFATQMTPEASQGFSLGANRGGTTTHERTVAQLGRQKASLKQSGLQQASLTGGAASSSNNQVPNWVFHHKKGTRTTSNLNQQLQKALCHSNESLESHCGVLDNDRSALLWTRQRDKKSSLILHQTGQARAHSIGGKTPQLGKMQAAGANVLKAKKKKGHSFYSNSVGDVDQKFTAETSQNMTSCLPSVRKRSTQKVARAGGYGSQINSSILKNSAALASYLSGTLPPYYNLVSDQLEKSINTSGQEPNRENESPTGEPHPDCQPRNLGSKVHDPHRHHMRPPLKASTSSCAAQNLSNGIPRPKNHLVLKYNHEALGRAATALEDRHHLLTSVSPTQTALNTTTNDQGLPTVVNKSDSRTSLGEKREAILKAETAQRKNQMVFNFKLGGGRQRGLSRGRVDQRRRLQQHQEQQQTLMQRIIVKEWSKDARLTEKEILDTIRLAQEAEAWSSSKKSKDQSLQTAIDPESGVIKEEHALRINQNSSQSQLSYLEEPIFDGKLGHAEMCDDEEESPSDAEVNLMNNNQKLQKWLKRLAIADTHTDLRAKTNMSMLTPSQPNRAARLVDHTASHFQSSSATVGAKGSAIGKTVPKALLSRNFPAATQLSKASKQAKQQVEKRFITTTTSAMHQHSNYQHTNTLSSHEVLGAYPSGGLSLKQGKLLLQTQNNRVEEIEAPHSNAFQSGPTRKAPNIATSKHKSSTATGPVIAGRHGKKGSELSHGSNLMMRTSPTGHYYIASDIFKPKITKLPPAPSAVGTISPTHPNEPSYVVGSQGHGPHQIPESPTLKPRKGVPGRNHK